MKNEFNSHIAWRACSDAESMIGFARTYIDIALEEAANFGYNDPESAHRAQERIVAVLKAAKSELEKEGDIVERLYAHAKTFPLATGLN